MPEDTSAWHKGLGWLRTGRGSMFKKGVDSYTVEALNLFKPLDDEYKEGAIKILTVLNELNKKSTN